MKQEFSMHSLGRAALRVLFAALVSSVVTALSMASFAQSKPANRGSHFKPQVLTTFPWDLTHQFFPESITAGRDGMLYVSVTDNLATGPCYILRLSPDGKRQEKLAFPSNICTTGNLLGVAFDEENRLHVAVADWSPGPGPGVYRVEHNGSVTCVLKLPDGSFPNGLAFYDGDMYVSDSFQATIWKKGPHGDAVVWLKDWTLFGWPGPNGIAFYRHSMYIAVISTGSIVRVPILHDGTAGAYEYVAGPDSGLIDIDGIAFDVTGRLWFTVNYGSDGSGGKLGTLDEDGKLRILADSPGWLDYPTMVVFGTTYRDRDTLYLTNGGLNGGKPNVLSFDVEVAGLPIPVDH